MKKNIFLCLSLFTAIFIASCSKEVNRPTASQIELSWKAISINYTDMDVSKSILKIKNNSGFALKNNWKLYFNYLSDFNAVKDSLPAGITITQINGDFYKLEPSKEYKAININDSLIIPIICKGGLRNLSDAPSGFYFVFNDDGDESEPEIAKLKIEAFGAGALGLNTMNPVKRFFDNQMMQKVEEQYVPKITPTPVSILNLGGKLQLTKNYKIYYKKGLQNEANLLNNLFSEVFGEKLPIQEGFSTDKNSITISQNRFEINGTSVEAYKILLKKENQIEIIGSDKAGLFYAIQSMRSLLPASAFMKKQETISLDAISIFDSPRFFYRGMHLDVARNFQSKESVLKLIDLMSIYKLNRLHLHISDDEGWRLEIPDLEELTEFGALRGHSKNEEESLLPSFGSGPFAKAELSSGSGFYTREDFIEILKYAKDRYVEVIPEIDLPGHARAAIKSMEKRYKKFADDGNFIEANKFRLIDPDDKSVYKSVQGWRDNVVCVASPGIYNFVKKVVYEMSEMYKIAGAKFTIVHTGGDEIPEGAWKNSPISIKYMAENYIENTDQLNDHFLEKIDEILNRWNLVLAGWQEVATKKIDGSFRPYTRFIKKGFVPYVWNTVWGWGQEDIANALANIGFRVVLSNVTNLYFDLAYEPDTEENGYYWGGYVDTKKVFEFTPFDLSKCAEFDLNGNKIDVAALFKNKIPLSSAGKRNILGIQGQLWSENLRSPEQLEYFACPKILGLAERAWSGQAEWAFINDEVQRKQNFNIDWLLFANALGQKELKKLDYFHGGFNYRIPPPGAFVRSKKLYANIAFPGLDIRYTTDSSEPTISSTLYKEPVDVTGLVKLRAFNTKGRGSRVVTTK